MAAVERPRTPLIVQLDQFGRWLSIVTLVVAVITFLVEFLIRDDSVQDAIATAISVAVALIPEGLPAVVTVTLALAVSTMASHNAIVRNLPAVETLGCVNVICTDKTGLCFFFCVLMGLLDLCVYFVVSFICFCDVLCLSSLTKRNGEGARVSSMCERRLRA